MLVEWLAQPEVGRVAELRAARVVDLQVARVVGLAHFVQRRAHTGSTASAVRALRATRA
mgnify:CR=1 FL=1